jgi:hypothetical protein
MTKKLSELPQQHQAIIARMKREHERNSPAFTTPEELTALGFRRGYLYPGIREYRNRKNGQVKMRRYIVKSFDDLLRMHLSNIKKTQWQKGEPEL